MMYFESGKFIIDFIAMSEFLAEYRIYAMIGIIGFMIGVIWHSIVEWKESRRKKLELKLKEKNEKLNYASN